MKLDTANNSNEIKTILQGWAETIDFQLDCIAHDGWDTGYIASALQTILEDRTNPAVERDPVAQHIIELAQHAQNSGLELMGPPLTILHLIDLYLHDRIDGFGYFIMLLTKEGWSSAELIIKPDQTMDFRAGKKIEELLHALLAEQPKHTGSTKEYAEGILQQLQGQLPIATDEQYSGPIVGIKMERQGFVDGKRAHNQFLYSPNSQANALRYSVGEEWHHYQLIKGLQPEQLDKLCALLLVDTQACRQEADELADGIKARSGQDDRDRYYLSNLSTALGRCDREDFYRIYADINPDKD